MPAVHTFVDPVKIRYHSSPLAVDVLAVKGYKGRCACGWEGDVRSSHAQAKADARIHRRKLHAQEEAARRREDVSATGGAESS